MTLAVLQGVDHPSARNNIAIALFASGDVEQARRVIESNWQASPENLFALDNAVRWRCWFEGLDRCRGFAAPLKTTQPRRPEDAIAQVGALRFLGEEKAALQAWEAANSSFSWRDYSNDSRTMFNNLRTSSSALPGSSRTWFPGPWLKAATDLGRSHSGISDTRWEQQWQALLDTCDAHGDYLMCAVDFGDDASRMLALSVLKQRARRHDRVAVSSLTALLTHPSGPDSARMELLNWLIEEGLRDRKEPADVWLGGELRPIRSHGFRISDKQHPSPFPPQGVALNERIHAAIGAHNLPLALDLAQQLHQLYPDQPLTLTNLAAIMEGLGRPLAEVADLFRRAFALAPDDLFARCGLARCFAKEGDIDQARTLLDGILEREEFHRSEYRSFLMAQRAIAVATGDHQSVLAVDQSLVDIEQSPKD